MSSGDSEVELVTKAIGGDRVALQQLLTLHASPKREPPFFCGKVG